MSKQFRYYDLNQALLLPPSLHEWLPEGHLARFLNEVVDELDLSAIFKAYEKDGRGKAAYHPGMLVRLLLYGYCIGVVSSRAIERATYEEVAFRYLSGDQHPDHDTIAEFRQRHLQSLAGLFTQALQLCQRAGLVKLGHVALDGTKVKANASKHKAMSYERMGETEKRLEGEIVKLLEAAEQTDRQEDAQYGKGRRGDELPVELARRESRLRKIREAKAALEAEAKEQAEAEKAAAEAKIAARRQQEAATGQKAKGRDPQVANPGEAQPDPKAQRNFTDADSRIMLDGATKSFEQAYNAQAVVDSQAQVIVAAAVTQQANDKQQLVPMLEQVAENLGQRPEKASADAGYFSEANVTDEKLKAVDLHVATGRQKHGEPVPEVSGAPAVGKTVIEQMREKLKTAAGREVYKRRKAVVEPVFGQIKEVRGFRRFSFRGKVKVAAEWLIVCLTHNLLKLFRAKVCFKTA